MVCALVRPAAPPHSVLCCRMCVCVRARVRPRTMLIGLRCARGEDEHVFALLAAGADDAIVTKRPWYNLAVEYSEGMVRRNARWCIRPLSPLPHRCCPYGICLLQSALAIAKFDVEEYDDSPTMLRIVEMLESAALGEWGERQEDFRRRVATDASAISESADSD